MFNFGINKLRILRPHWLYLIMLGFLLASCEEEIAIDINEVSKHVVVNSIFTPTEEFSVQLSYSRNILNPNDGKECIINAEVAIYNEYDEFLFEMDHQKDGIYKKANLYPKEGIEYRLRVKVDGYPMIKAQSQVPYLAEIENLRTEDVEINGESAIQVDFDIKNDASENNYYIWEVIKSPLEEINNSISGNHSAADVIALQDINSFQQGGTRWSKLFLSNNDSAASLINSSFLTLDSPSIEGGEGTDGDGEEQLNSFLKLLSASSDIYFYYLTVEQYQQQDNNNTSTGNPIRIHSNIEGGLGIFAGYNEQFIRLN